MSRIQIKTEKPDEELHQRRNFGHRQEANVAINRKQQKMPPPTLRQRAQQHSNLNASKQECWPAGRTHWNLGSTPRHSRTAAYPPGARCGEIFVANNARQWTFVCTFCDKSTRDIGDFICHIKIKHLQEYAACYDDEEDEYDDADEDMRNMKYDDGSAYEQDQDYFDCGGYLDVSVHTEPEEPEPSFAKSSKSVNQSETKQPAASSSHKSHTAAQGNGGDVLLDDGADVQTRTMQTGASATSSPKTAAAKDGAGKAETALTPNGGSFSQRAADYEDFEIGEFDTQNDYTPYEDDEDDDYDNQLLIAPNDSLLDGTTDSSNGDMKTKRRQIRGPAYCALCNKTFQYYSLYRNHMIKHSNETPFKCPLCKKGFKSKQAIRYHMHTHQKEKRFKCVLCNAGYYTENQFITHVLTHENASTFPCMVCGKILHSDKERDVHLTTHTDERPFRCEFCNKLFRLRHHLSNHLKMHRQYRCDYCKADFTSAVHLRKPYACPTCEQSPEVQEHVAANRTGTGAGTKSSTIAAVEVNPLELFEAAEVPLPPTECVDLAEMVSDSEEGEDAHAEDEEDDGEEEEESIYVSPPATQRNSAAHGSHKKRFSCKYCARTYSHSSGLNYHIRNKHR